VNIHQTIKHANKATKNKTTLLYLVRSLTIETP